MPPPCSACAAPAAPLACARCKCAFYCSAACQRAAWGAHKGVCVAGAADGLPGLGKWVEPQRCLTCGSDGALGSCDGCECATYCAEQCQRAAWAAHRDACRAAAAMPIVKDAQDQSRCSNCDCETPYHREMCGRCHMVSYCSEACAHAHWTGGHRGVCAAEGAALFSYIHAHADAGDRGAMIGCGLYYTRGVGVTADATAAVAWYTRAAEAGHVTAQLYLGCCYRDGRGVAADAAMAVTWFTRAADAGDSKAMNCLALCYEEGTGVVVDFAKSIALFTRAADAGNAVAQYNLGMRYLKGVRGVVRDAEKAREWLSCSAAGGDDDAAAVLAKLDAAAP